MGVNYGFEKVRFIAPVRSGKRVRGRFILASFEEKRPGQWQFVHNVTVEIEGEEKPALDRRLDRPDLHLRIRLFRLASPPPPQAPPLQRRR